MSEWFMTSVQWITGKDVIFVFSSLALGTTNINVMFNWFSLQETPTEAVFVSTSDTKVAGW